MKKILVPVLLIAAMTFSVTSCKKETKTAADGNEIVAADNAEDANAIIEFNNNLLQKREKRNSHIVRIGSYIDRVDDYISGRTPVLIAPIAVMDMSKIGEVPDAVGKDKEQLEKWMKESEASYTGIKKKTDELAAYLKAEDYKDDKGAKARILKEEIVKAATGYRAIEEKINKVMQPKADGAEELILKDHPLREYIIGNKKVFAGAENLTVMISRQFETGNFDAEAVKKAYSSLEAVVAANKEREFKVTEKVYESKKGYYDNFNKEAESFLGTVRKVLRDAEPSREFNEQQVNEVNTAVENLLSRYNNFVD